MNDETVGAIFRGHAARCRELAREAGSEEERRLIEQMAWHWDALADIRDLLSPLGRELD